MHCAACQQENPEGAKFCNACGAKLEAVCPQCGHANLPGSRFCNECGTPLTRQFGVQSSESRIPDPQPPASYTPQHLATRILAEQAAMEARGVTDGERKTITALFADMAGSTALIHDLDPEDARSLIDPVLHLMMDAVHRYEGYVAQPLGDGIFALFGAPIAHEDHPQRALYAALRMQEEMKGYADRVRLEKGVALQIRVGINTGEVVVRSIRKENLQTDYVPVGYSTHIASRMESIAVPGSIVVSEHTQKLTEGYFAFKALGATQVKGVLEPLNVYEVLGLGPLRTRLQVAARRGLVRFVGRQSEMDHLQKAFALAKTGHGQIVGVMGEPGVGKSRLFYEFVGAHGQWKSQAEAAPLPQSGCLVLETFSVSHGKAYPYLPLIELLKDYFQLLPHDDERRRREKVGGKVLMLDRSLEDTLPYLFFLLGIADPTAALQQMDPQIRRHRTFEALKRLLIRESLNQPLELIFEDLQWLDSETQAFLSFLSESVATARILLLVNYRPEYQHSWENKTYYTQLRLDPLGKQEAEELLTTLLGEIGVQHAAPLQRLILEKTEGNPFFMEEIVQELVERGVLTRDVVGARLRPDSSTGHVPLPADIHIPTTVQAVLASRIDRLPAEDKDLLQNLAVIGKEFPLSLLRQVVAHREDELHHLLSHLQAAEFIYEQPAFPEVEYTFKHALTQEVAYNSVLQERRKVLHERTAQAMEGLFHSRLEDHYGDLAHHYSRSGNTQKAVEYLHRAGEQAAQRSAHTEAISHLTTALELLQTLPDTPQRSQQELALQLTLGVPLQLIKGHAAPEVGKTYNRVLELCGQVGETAHLFPALFGLWRFYLLRSDAQKAHELAEHMMRLAQSSQDPSLPLEAHQALGTSLFWLGELRQGRRHLEQGIALYDIQKHRSHAVLYGIDPGVYCRCFAGWNLWYLGYPDQALKNTQDALRLAHELAHPHTLAFALTFLYVHQARHEATAVREQAEALLTLSTEHGFVYRAAWATIWRGWVLAAQGHLEEGLVRMQEGLAAQRATGAEAAHPYFLALVAEIQGKMGQPEEGLAALAEASALMQRTGEQWYEAELYRLKGTLTLQKFQVSGSKFQDTDPRSLISDAQSEAEACFQRAIEIARRQQAKSLELRAVTNLSRLWQQQGRKEEARRMLAEIYGWFTEGFDTKDLQEAKALLEELAS
ncbi:MAG TPA: adenylate/guanylate cyclase domain-containing protein [Candidatus Binatia bacterium]|nr:adenylate/guanylate cyclase domain-containing protein [Candidatus Binatia bacterium]